MKASLHNHRQAPRKMRLVADSVRGKRVDDVLTTLSFMPKKAAEPLKKLIESALANARVKDVNLSAADLMVKTITVDKGITMTRYMPRAFGRASPIKKIASHVKLELGPYTKKGSKKVKEGEAAETKPKAAPTKRVAKKKAE